MSNSLITELSDAPALPRIDSGRAHAENRLYGMPAMALPLALPPARTTTQGLLQFMSCHGAQPGIQSWGCHRFRFGTHTGTLCLDSVSLTQLLGEMRPELLPRELRTVLLADALHTAVQPLQDALRLRFDWLHAEIDSPPASDAGIGIVWRTHAEAPAVTGFVYFDDTASLAAVVPASLKRGHVAAAQLHRLRLPLRFEVGTAQISLHELRHIALGDVIGIECWASSGSAIHVSTMAGGARGLRLTGRADQALITLDSIGDTLMNLDDETDTAPLSVVDEPTGLPLSRLDALEVVLRFEVGELSMSIGELRSLRPGHVFELPEPLNRSSVRILAHGNVLGKGSLVAVGDRLGVRISDFALGGL